MSATYRYKAFISYSHSDRRWARWLHRKLEAYRAPRHLRVGESDYPAGSTPIRPVFRDRDELATSPDLSTTIREALEVSEHLVVICSPRAARSQWVNEEIELFKQLGRSERVLAMVVDGDPAARTGDAACFPSALRARYDSSGRTLTGDVEPVAADVRKAADGKAGALMKILAGLLGVGLDELVQREQHRRHQRMAIALSGSLAVSSLTLFLAVTAMLARDEADQRRQQAENMLSFMVGDLRERLEPIGRLDLLEEVGNTALEYFATVKVGRLTNSELARHAQVLTQLGEIRISQLQYDEALAAFTEAFERSAALSHREPSNGQHIFDRGQAEFWIAYVAWRNGDLAEARSWLTRYLDTALALAALDPTRREWRREVAYGHHNLAVLDLETGALDAAAEGFANELEILQKLQREQGAADLRRDIADAVSWLGNIAVQRGELLSALRWYEESLAELDALGDADPGDRNLQFDRAQGQLRVVESLALIGGLERGMALADGALAEYNDLFAHDPENLNWRRAGMNMRIQKGYLLFATAQPEAARTLARQSIGTLEELVRSDAADFGIRYFLSEAYALLALVDRQAGAHAEALEAVDRALEHYRVIESAGRLNKNHIGRYAFAWVLRGDVQEAMGTPADESWRQAEALLAELAPASRHPTLLDPWARVLDRTHRPAEAEAVRSMLELQQYRPLLPWTG